ncbi:hypothetical protein SUGI_0771520 [Cryptomeria japonica]|uniref:protein CHUP1, chloroplastic n=1 Tax=Cryptomeria japonica TaxID=3369 RepID=UPI0024148E63|nr:protein CHUP1, chloroplastic [Cryptomeria japonica]GLJ37918.1 hypothetical protein SUGI_0771520 [Cryptomeria japonica]
MVVGKAKTPVGAENNPPGPLLEVSKNVLLSNKKQSSVNSSLQKSKVRASEYSARVKRSLIGYLPKVNNAQSPGVSEPICAKRNVNELEQLEKELQEKEAELIEYKERVTRLSELEKELEFKNIEAQVMMKKIGSLEREKIQMREEIARVPALETELKAEKAHIEEMKKGDASNAEKKIQHLEIELKELRQSSAELVQQNNEFMSQLAAAESQIVALRSIAEINLVAKAETEESMLRHTNEDLRKQVEGLQMDRFTEVEELAHLRWVNANLHYQLSSYKQTSGKRSADDLNDSLSPNSRRSAKQLILECTMPELQRKRQEDSDNEGLSSRSSSTSESGDLDDLSFENFQGLIGISKRSRLIGKRKLTKKRNEWQFVQNLLDQGSEKDRSCNSSPRNSYSSCESKEPLEHHFLHHRRELNEGTAKISLSNGQQKTRLESSNDMPSTLQPTSKGSSFEDKQKIFLKKEKQIKEDNQVPKFSEVTKLTPVEVERRASRIPKPPPKPSIGPAATNGPINSDRKTMPPPPPPPPRAGSKVAPPPPPPPHAGSKGAPPPPPPPHLRAKGAPPPLPPPSNTLAPGKDVMQRAPEVVEFYHSLMKRDAKKDSSGAASVDTPNVANARSNMIGEIENRSSHLLAIKTDVETQGDFVRSLISEVHAAVYTEIEDVVAFVKWLDEELSFLVDERAVLKHFDWPERKADALREAAFGYCDLKKLETEVTSYEDDLHQPCDVALKKMLTLLEKLEHSVYSLLRMRDTAMTRYKEFQIPWDWMLDTGIVSKIKFASVKLAKKYMKRVAIELKSMESCEKELTHEFLMLQGVRFAFRVHQFAGGFDTESMSAFEQLRNLAHICHKKSQARKQSAGLPTC